MMNRNHLVEDTRLHDAIIDRCESCDSRSCNNTMFDYLHDQLHFEVVCEVCGYYGYPIAHRHALA